MTQTTSKLAHSTTTQANPKPCVLVVGPSLAQVGGVATFINILLASEELREKFDLIHLDTTRGKRGAGVASKLVPINLLYFARQTMQFLKISLRRKPQIIHLPINYSWAFWKEAAFILLARMLRMKVVAHLHGGIFDQYYHTSPPPTRRLIGWVLVRAHVIIALSDHWKHFLLENIRADLNIQVIPNTVDPMFARARHTNTSSQAERIVLFVGSLGHRKGVFDILHAVPIVASCFEDTRFLFAGEEETKSAGEKIKQLCAERRVNEHVEFLGVVAGQEKLELFQKAAVFVLPSYGENFPFALLEAMSVGLPVVTTPVGAIPELVEDGKNGFLIAPGDHNALADRILKLIQDPHICHEMGRANIALIQNKYLPETALHLFEQVYSMLLSPQ